MTAKKRPSKKANINRKQLNEYIVLDLEWNDMGPEDGKIIAVGLLHIKNGTPIKEYSQLTKPKRRLRPRISELTGITRKELSEKKPVQEHKEEILRFIGDLPIVGHDIKTDLRMLETAFGQKINNQRFDTLAYSKTILSKRGFSQFSLSHLQEQLKLSPNGHKGIDDCYTTFELFEILKTFDYPNSYLKQKTNKKMKAK